MVKANKPRVLLVDDEERITRSLSAILRRDFDITAVGSGCSGLAAIESEEPFDVIVSDMQMPEMNGACFLAKARKSAPYAQRIVLTGQATFDSAAQAVNEGGVSHFLTKPCTPNALREVLHKAVELRRADSAENRLLDETFSGSVQALADVLGLRHPALAHRSSLVAQTVETITEQLGLENRWHFKTAAMLATLGAVTLPPEDLPAALGGSEPADPGAEEWRNVPQVTFDLIAHIPRIECAAAVILEQFAQPTPEQLAVPLGSWSAVQQGAELLRTATAFVDAISGGQSAEATIEWMQASKTFSEEAVGVLSNVSFRRELGEPKSVSSSGLSVGVELVSDLADTSGTILAASGTTVTETLIRLARKYAKRGDLQEPITVAIPL